MFPAPLRGAKPYNGSLRNLNPWRAKTLWSFPIATPVKHTPKTGPVRTLFLFPLGCLLLAAALAVSAAPALAVSWQWQSLEGRERLTVYLDAPGAAKVERTDRTAITVTLPTPPQSVTQAPGSANPAAALVTKVSGQGQNLIISLKAPAFGYITTTPNPRQVQIDFFNDPLGARWKPRPGAATQSVAAEEKTPPAQAQEAKSPSPAPEKAAPESGQSATQQNERGQATPPAQAQARPEAASAPPVSGGLKEKDIEDAPPPTPLDTLFGILTDNETEGEQAAEQPPAQSTEQTQEQAPEQPAATPSPPQPQAQATPPAQAQVQNAPQTQPETAPVPTPPVQTVQSAQSVQSAQPTPPPVATPEPGQAQGPTALGGEETLVAPADQNTSAPKGGATASEYAFMGAINTGGPENWTAQTSAPGATTPVPPAQGTPLDTSGTSSGSNAANGQSAPITPIEPPQDTPPAQAQATQAVQTPGGQPVQAQTPQAPTQSGTIQNETSDALEEVIKNPPAMVSTTGQLAQAQNNIAPLAEAPGQVPATQPATGPATEPATQSPAHNATASAAGQAVVPEKTSTPEQGAAPPPKGTTAAGEVFGVVGEAPATPVTQASAAHNATVAPDSAEHAAEPPPQLDEDGNPIPPPPDPDALLKEAGNLLASREYQKALDAYNAILALPNLNDEQREMAMYGVSDAQFGLGQDNLPEHFAQIVDSTERAMNFNLKSTRVPSLLLRLGYVNMKMDNVQEAEAYFNMLKRKYPNDPNIPLTYYYWGDYFFKKEDFRRSSDQFQYIVQNYPDSRYVRESSMGLARSLYNLGYYEQAYQVGEYIDKRWPRFYVEYPAVLSMFGDMAIRLNKLDNARRYYWTYYNIAPTGDDADTSLVHLGDIYIQQNKLEAAQEVYQNAVDSFPKRDGGLIAQMRLVEGGIHDNPMIPEMDQLFDKGYNLRPMEVYNHIIKDFPESKLAPLATLKLAMWEMWNKRYEDALKSCEQFAAKYPKHALLPNVQEVALTAFSRLTADSLTEDNYARILRAWNSAPALQALEERLTPEVRLALSLSKVNQHKSADALKDLDPFFRGAKDPEFGDSALTLALSTLVDTQSWAQIEPLALRVSTWELKPETKAQLDYARALAFENLGQPEAALPLWEGLKTRGDLPLQLQAYTTYFLSRAALRNNDMQNAYYLSRQALQSLSDIGEADPTKADTAKIKTLLGSLLDITESSGRTAEALEWYQQYAQYVRETDEEWPSLRFRLAQLYKAAGDTDRWASLLKELTAQYPDTLYGRMAASELETHKLRQNISDFMPPAGQ